MVAAKRPSGFRFWGRPIAASRFPRRGGCAAGHVNVSPQHRAKLQQQAAAARVASVRASRRAQRRAQPQREVFKNERREGP